MDKLSPLELKDLLEIVDHGIVICRNDDAGITWGYEDELYRAREMLRKALKTNG